MTILYAAHQAIEQLTLDRDLIHLRDRLAPEVAEMVYYGFWYTAKMDALMAFIREAQKTVDGEVTLNLYKGNIIVAGRKSPKSLYDEGIASMEGGGSYNQTDAEGFLRIQGCRCASKAASRREVIERISRRCGDARLKNAANACKWTESQVRIDARQLKHDPDNRVICVICASSALALAIRNGYDVLLENPVLQRELLVNLRTMRAFVLLFFYNALLGLVVVLAWPRIGNSI